MKLIYNKIQNNDIEQGHFNCVPPIYDQFLRDLNSCIDPKETNLLGRKKEITEIWNCISTLRKQNVVLLGEHGVGKTAIIQKMSYNVMNKKCPPYFYGVHFLELKTEYLAISLSKVSNQRKIAKMFQFLINNQRNIILVIDQMHLILTNALLSHYISTLIINNTVKIIGLSTYEEFYDFFKYDSQFRSRLKTIDIQEPKSSKIYPMLKAQVKNLENLYKIKISQDIVEYIISVSNAFKTEKAHPELTLDILEKSIVYAKRNQSDELLKKDINSNFKFNYKLFKKIPFEEKQITAYHEAGHYVVSKLSEHIRNMKTIAITIVPAENFLGVTMFELEYEKQLSLNLEYFVDNIASDLGGRVAEGILQEKNNMKISYTSGARQDLQNATSTARNIVGEYGMIEDGFGENMAYLNGEDISGVLLMSEKEKNALDEEIKKLIKQAEERAKKILTENVKLLENVASELLENEVLDEKDLDRIYLDYMNSKN